MKKLIEVEEAKALMNEAIAWSVMKWLTQKKSVRKCADKANNALWALQKEMKSEWPQELRTAYEALTQNGDAKKVDAESKALAKRVKEADDEADKAHVDAEETFAKAEKILSTSLARDGCRKAIESWDLYEKAITKAEAGIRKAVTK